MKYQITAPLNNFISQCAGKHKGNRFPAALITSTDPAFLAEAVKELSGKLLNLNIIKQSGTPFLNFRLANSQDFKAEFQRLVHMLNMNARYTNSYRGVVAVDLSEWQQDAQCRELDAVLAYLQDTEKDRIYIFYAATQKAEPLHSALRAYFTVEDAALKMEKPMQIYNYTVGLLSDRYGVQVEETASTILYKAIAAMAQEADFCGVSTLHSFCRDIALETNGLLSAESISNFRRIHPGKKTQPRNEIGLIK